MSKKNVWKDRRVLVTGGSGLLGAELVSQLVDLDAHVVVVLRDRVNKSRFFSEGLDKKVDIAYGDIVDFSFVERVVVEYEVDTIFHLAAQTIVGIANRGPLSTFESNIKGTWNVMEAARQHQEKIKAVVVASSDKAYGKTDVLPYDEDIPLRGRHPYDVSKSCTDLVARSYWYTYELPVSVTRCGNLFGPGDLNFSRIIPGTIQSLLNGERPIVRSDGKFIRNYFYIKDAAKGYLTIAENMDKAAGEAFNLGTEERFSVLEIIDIMAKVMDSDLEPVVKNEASNEIVEQYLDISKANKMLDWEPTYTTEEAIRETVEWYRKNI